MEQALSKQMDVKASTHGTFGPGQQALPRVSSMRGTFRRRDAQSLSAHGTFGRVAQSLSTSGKDGRGSAAR